MAQAVYFSTGLSSCSPRLFSRPSFVQRFGSAGGGGEGEREGIDFPSTSVGEGINFPSTSLGESEEELGEVGIIVGELGSTCTNLGGGGAGLAVAGTAVLVLVLAAVTAAALHFGGVGLLTWRRRERLRSLLRALRGGGGAGAGAGGAVAVAVELLPGR